MGMKNLFVVLALIWVSKGFMTIEEMVQFLNTLPEQYAKEAKVIVLNSQRSFLGPLSKPYYLIYRTEN